MSSVICFYPPFESPQNEPQNDLISRIRHFNDTLSWEGIQYVVETLRHVIDCLDRNQDDFVLTTLFPSLAAALCLVPNSIPVLSQRIAITLLPHLSKFFPKLDKFCRERQAGHRLFRTGLMPGKWVIRATGSSGDSNNFEEYIVDISTSSSSNEQGLSTGFEGSGVGTTGKSKSGVVAIFGAVKGSSVHFVEEWSDGSDEGLISSSPDETSSCVVAARLSLGGTKFEGSYRNVQFGTTGQIAGMLRTENPTPPKFRLKDAPASAKQSAELAGSVVSGEAVMCLAYNHMATIIAEDGAGDHSTVVVTKNKDVSAQLETLKKCLSGSLLSGSSLKSSDDFLSKTLESLKEKYNWDVNFEDPHGCRHLYLLDPVLEGSAAAPAQPSKLSVRAIEEKVEDLDAEVARRSGGAGSLRKLCPDDYDQCRKRIICALISAGGVENDLLRNNTDKLETVWRVALKIMEDGLRAAMANAVQGQSFKQSCSSRCTLYNDISAFLHSLDFSTSEVTLDVASQEISSFYMVVKEESDLDFLRSEMEAASKRALLRLVSLREVVGILSNGGDSSKGEINNPVTLEAIIVGLPRLLGRSQTEAMARIRKQKLGRPVVSDAQDLGNHYSSYSYWSHKNTQIAIRGEIHRMFRVLGQIADKVMLLRRCGGSAESSISLDSLLLSLLTVFTTTLKKEDIKAIVHDSGIMKIIPWLISQHKDSLVVDNSPESTGHQSVVKKLQVVCQREISRSVLRASVAASHALIFQTSLLIGKKAEESSIMSMCTDLLFGELQAIFKTTEEVFAEISHLFVQKRADADWESWCHVVCPTFDSKKTSSQRQVGNAGLEYLEEHGAAHICGPLLASAQKPSSRQKGTATSNSRVVGGDARVTRLRGGFSYQLLTQWLNVLCGTISSRVSRSVIAKDSKWISLLLEAVGLSVSLDSSGIVQEATLRSQEDGLLPGRFRSRIMRFVFPLLETLDPNEQIICGILCLAGATSPSAARSIDEDEVFVAREAVTLLRQLHSPSRPLWRKCVNESVLTALSTDAGASDKFLLQLGVLSFVSGSLEPIGRGSYVLLKPAAAAPLSADQQSSPSSKSHSSGSGGSGSGIGATPHHIVGNGTEGVIAGLCRHDASAGLVSSVDMKNGICEVVLLMRETAEIEDATDASLLERLGHAGSKPLTVRALRASLSDVVLAQEAPLSLDHTIAFVDLFGALLEPSLEVLSSALKPEAKESLSGVETLKSTLAKHSAAIMLIRSAIVALSDKRIASKFLEDESSRKILGRILRLAWLAESDSDSVPDCVSMAQKRYLSSLPVHEARYGHLVSLTRELSTRDLALKNISKEQWAKRLKEFQLRWSEAKEAETKETEESGTTEAPSGDTGLAAQSGSLSASGIADMDSISRNADSASNRGISQSTASSEDEEESEAAATAAAHLREAAIAQMAELGLPRSWSELALRRTGGTDIEAAVHFCLERGGEMERLLAEERERERVMQRQSGSGASSRRRGYRGETGSSNHLLRQLLEMGFPSRWCTEALAATGNNVDEALTWILTHGERLSEEDEAMEDEDAVDDEDEDDDDSMEDDDEDEDAEAAPDAGSESASNQEAEKSGVPAWSGSIVPLRFISGRSIIDSKTLEISGLPTGGFSSVGTKGVLLCSGKWYYEAVLETAGCLQIGWADGSFAGHCHADRGDGTGDGPRYVCNEVFYC